MCSSDLKAMYNEAGEAIDSCPHAGQTVWLELSSQAGEYDLLRKREQDKKEQDKKNQDKKIRIQ